MIQDVMRKHKTALLWIILLLIIVPFVFWGGFSGLGRGKGGDGDLEPELGPIAQVRGVALPYQYFRQAITNALQRGQTVDPTLTLRDLEEDETAMTILEQLVTNQLIDLDAAESGIAFEQDYLEEQLRKDPRFLDAQGNFDPKKYNQWIEDNESRRWSAEYARVAQTERRALAIKRLLAPVRVRESEVRKRFEEDFTKLRVRYVTVEPRIEPTDEQIRRFYEAFPQRYEIPDTCQAQFAAVSLKPPKPALVDELVERARTGEDFAGLAKAHSSAPDKENGGEMGWQTESPLAQDHREALFELAPGEVSDAVDGPAGYYIFKAEEERTNETTGQREVRGRQIVITPELSEEESEARMAQAEAVAAKAKESGDLAAAAAEAGLELQETGSFSNRNWSIENVSARDTWIFSMAVLKLLEGEVSDVISATDSLYIAKMTDYEPSVVPPLEEVRDEVIEDAIAGLKRTPKYRKGLERLADVIGAECSSLQEVLANHPDLASSATELAEFTVAEYRPMPGPRWDAREVYEAVGWGEPGAFGGPIIGNDGAAYFVELLSKTPPDESVIEEKWEEQRPLIRDRLVARAQDNRIKDYVQDERLRGNWSANPETYEKILELRVDEEDLGSEAGPAADEAGVTGEIPADEPSPTTPEEIAPSDDTLESTVPEEGAPEDTAPSDEIGASETPSEDSAIPMSPGEEPMEEEATAD